MAQSTMECGKCGNPFSTELQMIGEDGNPICPDCYAKEQHEQEREKR